MITPEPMLVIIMMARAFAAVLATSNGPPGGIITPGRFQFGRYR
jgi:hypothetical protein